MRAVIVRNNATPEQIARSISTVGQYPYEVALKRVLSLESSYPYNPYFYFGLPDDYDRKIRRGSITNYAMNNGYKIIELMAKNTIGGKVLC